MQHAKYADDFIAIKRNVGASKVEIPPLLPKSTKLFPAYGCKAYIIISAYPNCSAAISGRITASQRWIGFLFFNVHFNAVFS